MKRFLSLILTVTFCLVSPTYAANLLMEDPTFQHCEAEAFIALIIARNGMHLRDTRESLLAVKSNRDFQIRTINQVFDEIEGSGNKDHGGFAARKFYECARRENLDVKEDLSGAAVCLARHDIVFFVTSDRVKGIHQPEALSRITRFLSKSSKAIYPDALIEQLVPMVYRVTSSEDDYQLRQLVFETCLFPEAWQAWYQAVQARGK